MKLGNANHKTREKTERRGEIQNITKNNKTVIIKVNIQMVRVFINNNIAGMSKETERAKSEQAVHERFLPCVNMCKTKHTHYY